MPQQVPSLGIGGWQKMMYKYMDLGPLAFDKLPECFRLYCLAISHQT